MKQILLALGVGLIVTSSAQAIGSAGDLGLGFSIGQPIGLTGKYWIDNRLAVDAGAGYHISGNFSLNSDILYHMPYGVNVAQGRMPFYFGVGMRALLGKDDELGIRIPVGASYMLPSDPIELYAEFAPVIEFTGDVDMGLDGGVGVRFYFNYVK
jgi:hypothetical protein